MAKRRSSRYQVTLHKTTKETLHHYPNGGPRQ